MLHVRTAKVGAMRVDWQLPRAQLADKLAITASHLDGLLLRQFNNRHSLGLNWAITWGLSRLSLSVRHFYTPHLAFARFLTTGGYVVLRQSSSTGILLTKYHIPEG